MAHPQDQGELNPKYPGGLEAHKARLEAEGHTVRAVGNRYLLADLDESLCMLGQLDELSGT